MARDGGQNVQGGVVVAVAVVLLINIYILYPTSSLSSLRLSEGVFWFLPRVLLNPSVRKVDELVIGDIIVDTALFSFPGVRLNEKARPT